MLKFEYIIYQFEGKGSNLNTPKLSVSYIYFIDLTPRQMRMQKYIFRKAEIFAILFAVFVGMLPALSGAIIPPGHGCVNQSGGCPNICYFYPQLCNNTVSGGNSTNSSTTTTIGSGGNGGGGSYNGGGPSAPSGPTLTQSGSCVTASDFTAGEEFGFLAGGPTFIISNDYIGKNYANISVNNVGYTLVQQISIVTNSTALTLKLLGIKSGFNPSISMSACYAKQVIPTTTVTSVPTTTIPANTTAPAIASTAQQSQTPPLSLPATTPVVGGLALAGVGATRLRRRLVRGRKEHIAMEPGLVRTIEELGVIDTALFIGMTLAFISGYVLLAAIIAFAFGITLTYLLDHLRSRNAIMETIYERKEGLRRYIEEFGIIEILIFLIAALLLLKGYYAYGVFFAFMFGILFTFFVDRIREVSAAIKKEIEMQDAINMPVLEPQTPPAAEKPKKKSGKRGKATKKELDDSGEEHKE